MKKFYKFQVFSFSAFLLFFFLLSPFLSFSQKATITDVVISPTNITVTYDLTTTDPVDVTLCYSLDNKCTWHDAVTVTNNTCQYAGLNKTIIWDNIFDGKQYGIFYFKLKTEPIIVPPFTCMSNTFPTYEHTPTASQQVSVPIKVSTTKDAAGNYVHFQGASPTATDTTTIYLKFLTYNLGAMPCLSPKEQMKQVYAVSPNDIRVYGGLYQWGRKDAEHSLRCNRTDAPEYFQQAPTNAECYPVATYNPDIHTKFVWDPTLTNGWWANGEVGNSNLWGNGCPVGSGCPSIDGVNPFGPGVNSCQGTTNCNGGNSRVSKRPNDPCPVGYRIPTQHEWALFSWEGGSSISPTNDASTSINDITVSRSGLVWVRVRNGLINGTWATNNMCGYAIYAKPVWDVAYLSPPPAGTDLTLPVAPEPLLFLPAAGNRDCYLGATLSNVGTMGHFWSSTVTGNNSHFIYFTSGAVNASTGNHRAYGFPVRCIAE